LDIAIDISRGELVEKELDAMIARRSRHNPEREREEMYMESVRRYNARRQEANRAEWAAYHRQQAERHRHTLERLIAVHEARAEALTEGNERMNQ
jgi:hypothetical protein